MIQIDFLEDIAGLRESVDVACKQAQLQDGISPEFLSGELTIPDAQTAGQEIMA